MSQWIARKGLSVCNHHVVVLESLRWGVLKFLFVLCIYLSQGVFHFVLGKSSYNLMLKKIP